VSRLDRAKALAVRLPLRAADVVPALRATHDDEAEALWLCELALKTGATVATVAESARDFRCLGSRRCTVTASSPTGFCPDCGRPVVTP